MVVELDTGRLRKLNSLKLQRSGQFPDGPANGQDFEKSRKEEKNFFVFLSL